MQSTEILGIGLIALSVLLFVLEIKAPGFGALGIGGAVALVAGVFLAFGLTSAALPVLIAATIPLIGVVLFLALLAHRARQNKIVTGDDGMIGLEGKAETDLLPEGKVLVRGELWDAWSPVRLERGQPVRVTGVRGLRLEVSAASPDHAVLQPRSVVRVDEEY